MAYRNIGRRLHAFTLIELLVSVAIIGLLIAILVPAVGMAPTTASTAQGLSNLNALSLATYNCAADNRQALMKPGGEAPGVTNLALASEPVISFASLPFSTSGNALIKPFANGDLIGTDKGNFICGADPYFNTSLNTTLPNSTGLVGLPRVGYWRLWADPIWEGGYVNNPAVFQDRGKPATGNIENAQSGVWTPFNIKPDGTTQGFKDHDANGNPITPQVVTGLGCAYQPSCTFFYGTPGGFPSVNTKTSYGYYDASQSGRTMNIDNRPHPADNMWLMDQGGSNSPTTATAWGYTNNAPYRNGSTVFEHGTSAALFFDGHATTVNNTDIYAFTNAPLNARGFPLIRALADAFGNTLPDPALYPSYIGGRFWDCRNTTPLGPGAGAPNMAHADAQNYYLNALDP